MSTGKVGLQYERVIGNSSSGFLNKLDPALSKLGTGKLELEVLPPDDDEKKPLQKQDQKPVSEMFTLKNVTIDDVDEKAGTISVSFGNEEKPTKLVNVPLDKGVRVVASHVLPGTANNLPFEWAFVERLKGKTVSVRLIRGDGLSIVSIASGND